MEDDENYFSYDADGEEIGDGVENNDEDIEDTFWGTYAYAPFVNTAEISNIDAQLYSTTHHRVVLFYQKEIAIGMGAWIKKPMWDAQEPYINALHEFWLSGMMDYLAEIREEKKEPSEPRERGIPVTRNTMCTRRKPNERNEL
jgi:hypothetical protein